MVGFKDKIIDFEFPEPVELNMMMDDVFEGKVNKTIGYTLRVGGRDSGIGDRHNWDTYIVDGGVRQLSSKEGLRMQGFPDDFEFPVSEAQAMKQLGNSVAVPAIQATADEIIKVDACTPTANKGEWSELYVLFKLSSESKIKAADMNLQPTDDEYTFCKYSERTSRVGLMYTTSNEMVQCTF